MHSPVAVKWATGPGGGWDQSAGLGVTADISLSPQL